MKKFVKSVVVLFFVMLFSNSVFAQTEKLQSIFIYNFISKFVEWPSSYKSGDFVIGVLGNSPIIAELNTMAASKTVGGQKIVVKKFNSAAEIDKCHVLFIPAGQSGQIGAALGKVGNTLVVTDKDGMCSKGAAINFVLVDNKQKFELNKGNASSKGLKVSPELEKLAIPK